MIAIVFVSCPIKSNLLQNQTCILGDQSIRIMELPDIGQVCVICRRNDYLPFKCSHCEKIVCIDHRADHGPECPLEKTSFQLDQSNPSISLRAACDFCKRITLELELSKCDKCIGRHCLHHRHYVQHNCCGHEVDLERAKREAEDKVRRQQEAISLIKETYKPKVQPTASSSISKSKPLPSDPKKRELAKRLRVMRLKQFAKGPSNILDADRIYFEATFCHQPESSLSSETKHGKSIKMFTRIDYPIGRMLDWCAAELDLANKNNIVAADQLVFQKQMDTGEMLTLNNSSKFGENMEANNLDNGDELFLTYLRLE